MSDYLYTHPYIILPLTGAYAYKHVHAPPSGLFLAFISMAVRGWIQLDTDNHANHDQATAMMAEKEKFKALHGSLTVLLTDFDGHEAKRDRAMWGMIGATVRAGGPEEWGASGAWQYTSTSIILYIYIIILYILYIYHVLARINAILAFLGPSIVLNVWANGYIYM